MSITRFAGSERSPVVKSDQTSKCLFFPAWKLQKYCDGFYDSIGQQPWSRNVKIWPTQLNRNVIRILCRPRHLWTFSIPSMTKNRWQQLLFNAYGFLCDLRSVRLVSPKLVEKVEICMNFSSAKPNTSHTSHWCGNGISRCNCQILADDRDYHVFDLRWGWACSIGIL